MYELKETPIMEQPIVDTSNFVTREEFDSVIKNLELTFSKQEVKKDESNDSKTGSSKSVITF